jgi:hypothetical protein
LTLIVILTIGAASAPAADDAYVGCTNCVAEFFRTALNDLAGVSQDGYCLSLIVRQL